MRIAIIGAGINGLYLAKGLVLKGHEVAIFERKSEIGKEICSGLFSSRIFDFFPESKELVKHKLSSCLIRFPKKEIKLGFKRPFFIIEHKILDKLAASLAQKSGAVIHLNYSITEKGMPSGFDRIIGCDGVLSVIRANLGLKNPDFRLGIQGFVFQQDDQSIFEVWPTKTGFFWKIPRGDSSEYGLIGKPEQAVGEFNEVLAGMNIKPELTKAALIPRGLIIPKNNQIITLCGDAAGLTKPWSGGGVIWGLTAADLLIKHFPNFLTYKKETERFFRPQILFSKIITKAVYFLGFNFPSVLPKTRIIDNDFLF